MYNKEIINISRQGSGRNRQGSGPIGKGSCVCINKQQNSKKKKFGSWNDLNPWVKDWESLALPTELAAIVNMCEFHLPHTQQHACAAYESWVTWVFWLLLAFRQDHIVYGSRDKKSFLSPCLLLLSVWNWRATSWKQCKTAGERVIDGIPTDQS